MSQTSALPLPSKLRLYMLAFALAIVASLALVPNSNAYASDCILEGSEITETLNGVMLSDSTGRVINTSTHCSFQVGIASYKWVDNTIDNQVLFDFTIGTVPAAQVLNGTLDLQVALPGCAAQVDIFYGDVLLSLDGQRYGERLLRAWSVDILSLCDQEEGEGGLTIGYWKNHQEHLAEMLAIGPIDLGDTTVTTVQEARAIFKGAKAKDARNQLRAQLLGAILNIRNGADPSAAGDDIGPTIDAAIAFLAAQIGDPILGGDPDRDECLELKDLLDEFNNSGDD